MRTIPMKFSAGILLGLVVGFCLGFVATFAWVVWASNTLNARAQRPPGQVAAKPTKMDPPRLEVPLTRDGFDFGLGVEDASGQQVDLGQYRGKTLVVNVWASWCSPCVRELPSLVKLADVTRAGGKVVVVLVSVDKREDFRRFAATRPLPGLAVRLASDDNPWRMEPVPFTFIVAPDGHVIASARGMGDWAAPQVLSFLSSAGAGAPPG